jgi:hypothetical protein
MRPSAGSFIVAASKRRTTGISHADANAAAVAERDRKTRSPSPCRLCVADPNANGPQTYVQIVRFCADAGLKRR